VAVNEVKLINEEDFDVFEINVELLMPISTTPLLDEVDIGSNVTLICLTEKYDQINETSCRLTLVQED